MVAFDFFLSDDLKLYMLEANEGFSLVQSGAIGLTEPAEASARG